MRPARALLAVLLLTALAAGCGSDKPAAPTKTAYVQQADAICRSANAKVTAEAKKVFTTARPTPEQIRAYADHTFLPVIGQEVKDLRGLRAPEGDEATTKAIFDAVDAGLARADANPALLAASGAASPFAVANHRALAYGLKVCGAS